MLSAETIKSTTNFRIFAINRNFHNCDKKNYYSINNFIFF